MKQIEAFKVWIFPTLVSILAMLIWNDVSEIKSDVSSEKELPAPSSTVENDHQAPLDNGSTEEVDKW